LFETSVMGPEAGSADSLSRAIEELREELLSWIDNELARLQELEQREDRAAEAISGMPGPIRSGLGGGRRLVPPTDGDGARPRTHDVTGMERESSRDRGWRTDRDSEMGIAESSVAMPGSEWDAETQAPPLNPRERLDALARLLDHRLKLAEGAAGVSRDATGGRGEGMRDEPRNPPGKRGAESSSGRD
jgi:hypothetical protein